MAHKMDDPDPDNRPIVCIGPKICPLCFYCRKALRLFTVLIIAVILIAFFLISQMGMSVTFGDVEHTHNCGSRR